MVWVPSFWGFSGVPCPHLLHQWHQWKLYAPVGNRPPEDELPGRQIPSGRYLPQLPSWTPKNQVGSMGRTWYVYPRTIAIKNQPLSKIGAPNSTLMLGWIFPQLPSWKCRDEITPTSNARRVAHLVWHEVSVLVIETLWVSGGGGCTSICLFINAWKRKMHSRTWRQMDRRFQMVLNCAKSNVHFLTLSDPNLLEMLWKKLSVSVSTCLFHTEKSSIFSHRTPNKLQEIAKNKSFGGIIDWI